MCYKTAASVWTLVPHQYALKVRALCSTGPICSLLVKKFGCRATVMLGGVLSGLGLAASFLIHSIKGLYVTAIITGQPTFGWLIVRAGSPPGTLDAAGAAVGPLGGDQNGKKWLFIGYVAHSINAAFFINVKWWRLMLQKGLHALIQMSQHWEHLVASTSGAKAYIEHSVYLWSHFLYQLWRFNI